MPCLTTWAAFLLRSGVAHVDNVITKRCSKQSHGCSCQGCQATNHTGTLPNLPNSASGTYAPADRLASGTSLRNLPPEPAPARAGTLRNPPESITAHTGTLRHLPELASTTYTSTHRNLPEPSGTCLRNLHQHTPELSGTFRNLPSEPAPATRTGTHRSLSGLKTPLAYGVGEKLSIARIKPFSHKTKKYILSDDIRLIYTTKNRYSNLLWPGSNHMDPVVFRRGSPDCLPLRISLPATVDRPTNCFHTAGMLHGPGKFFMVFHWWAHSGADRKGFERNVASA